MEKVKFEKIDNSKDDWRCIGNIYEKTSEEEKEIFGVDVKKKREFIFNIYQTTFEDDCNDFFYRFVPEGIIFYGETVCFKSLEEAKQYAIKKFEKIKSKFNN